MSNEDSIDPDEYVQENSEQLQDVIRHSDDDFTRALAIVALTKFGDEPAVDQLRAELDAAEEVLG